MGTVYRAWDLRLDRPVALKVIAESLTGDATFRKRFQREAIAAAAAWGSSTARPTWRSIGRWRSS
jgi:serine/threonine protein kinase